MQEDVKDAQDQPTADREVLPVLAIRQFLQQAHRCRGHQTETERVDGSDQRNCVFDTQFARGHRIILPQRGSCGKIDT